MGTVSATQLIAMVRDEQHGDRDVVEAFLHFVPGLDGSYEELLSVLALLRPQVFLEMGVPLENIHHTQGVLCLLREKHILKPAS